MPQFNDEIWKRSIHTLFRPMVGFHFPELHPLIDWSREPAFLEEELANLFDPKKEGKRFVDWVVTFSDSKARNNFVGAVRTMATKEEIHMPYVTSIEEVTREETRIETRLEIATRMLEFGDSDEKIFFCARISPEELAEIKERIRHEAR